MFEEQIKKCLEYGKAKEEDLKILLKTRYGNVIRNASDIEDMKLHYDIIVDNEKIDVKGLKKSNRNADDFDEFHHFIELKNVNGKNGWLYGNADSFAFETFDYWIFVDAKKLREYIKIKIQPDRVFRADECLYKQYTRKDRSDLMTKIKSIDLCSLSKLIIAKNENEDKILNPHLYKNLMTEDLDKSFMSEVKIVNETIEIKNSKIETTTENDDFWQ